MERTSVSQLKGCLPLLLIVAILGFLLFRFLILPQVARSRAHPDFLSLAAAVQHFSRIHGRLPTEQEYPNLQPDPDFHLPWVPTSPESQTSFANPRQTAGTIVDPFMQPYVYERVGDSFLIRSIGIDGKRSRDDIVYDPMEAVR